MIGIIAAMDVEMKSLRSFMTDTKTETVSGITFVSGTLEGKLVVTAVCGIGKVFAAMCAQTMILRYQPECIVNTGVAGALSDKLSIGSVAISSAVVQHDMDTSALGDPLGLISGVNKVQLPADSDLCGQLSACATVLGIRTETGVIASGDQFISSAERKDAIIKTFGAIACEMEGAAIGQVCYVNRVPFCVLRAISDSADGSSHMDYPTFVGMAAEQLNVPVVVHEQNSVMGMAKNTSWSHSCKISASARAGLMWPAVPPPVRTNFIVSSFRCRDDWRRAPFQNHGVATPASPKKHFPLGETSLAKRFSMRRRAEP